MPSFGGGAGRPIVPGPVATDVTLAEWCTGALPLSKYATQYIGYECGFWGVSRATEPTSVIWTLFERQELARALCEAQEEIEQVAGYFLQPKWIQDEVHKCSPTGNYLLDWNYLIDGGVAVVDDTELEMDAAVDHTNDPAVIGPIATTVTDPAEIRIYYPDTSQEIIPLDILISGGFVNIYIPRCRLVGIDYVDNPVEGLDYADLAVFQKTVDVYRIYNDNSDPGEFITRTVGECDTDSLAICLDVKDAAISHIRAYLAATSSCGAARIDQANINYASGLIALDRIADLAITRLAHSKMPTEPCGYDRIKGMWRKDNTIPIVLSVERLECTFGLSNGAWMAWKFAAQISMDKMTVWA
jgi:hypothetical protein